MASSDPSTRTVLIVEDAESCATTLEIALLGIPHIHVRVAPTARQALELLASAGATWKDVVRTTCYLRDIERDYEAFNEIRTQFFKEQELDPLPASTGIQAILCRPDLLIEIEAIAIFESDRNAGNNGQ